MDEDTAQLLERARQVWSEVRTQTRGTAIPPTEPPPEFVAAFSTQEQISGLRERVEELESK